MSKSTPINVIETDDDQTIQQVLEDLEDADADADVDDNEEQYVDADANHNEKESRRRETPPAQHRQSSKTHNEGLQFPNLTNDITDVLIVFSIYLIVSHLPVEQLIYRYISLEHIPLSKTIIKATISAALFIMIKKIIKFI